MYVLNIVERTITKMDSLTLANFLNDCAKSEIEISNFLFIPNKKQAKQFIENTLGEQLPQCQHWK